MVITTAGFFKGIDLKQALSWALFDFANSAYSLIIISFIFPIYFKEVVAAGTYGDLYWGICISLSILVGAFASPIVGAIADYDSRRKIKFMMFALVSMIGTASLYFSGPGTLFLASLIFIVTNFFFELAIVMYDSFLLHVSTPETAGRISGLGWGLGYVGGVVAMLLLRPFYENGYVGVLDPTYRLTFPLTALFFFVFSVPFFLFVKEKRSGESRESLPNLIKIGISRTLSTLREIRKHKRIAWFLVAFYFLNDVLVTLFAFIPIYARNTLSLDFSDIFVLFALIQLIGFPSAVFFGWLSDKKGPKRILLVTIAIWTFILVMLALTTSKTEFYILAVMAGLVIGSSQAVARSWLSKIIPVDKQCEFFGFNGFASKVAATTGPLIFGIVSSVTMNQRIAMLALLPFFVISFIIFLRIEE